MKETIITRATDPSTTVENVYQWGVSSLTIDAPQVEALQHFIDRKGGQIIGGAKPGVLTLLSGYQSTHPDFRFFVGTQAEFDIYKQVFPIREKADKGQEVENAIELNKIVANYWREKIDKAQSDIDAGMVFSVSSSPVNTNKLLEVQGHILAKHGYIDSWKKINDFEADIAIATNSDPAHQVDWLEETEFVQTLEDIFGETDKKRWIRITKLLGVEEAYEPENIVAKYKEIQQAVNTHITGMHFTGTTLAGELANAHDGA